MKAYLAGISLCLVASTALAAPFHKAPSNATPIIRVQLACGIPPIPPVGCRVSGCICDQNRQNCQWQFACN